MVRILSLSHGRDGPLTHGFLIVKIMGLKHIVIPYIKTEDLEILITMTFCGRGGIPKLITMIFTVVLSSPHHNILAFIFFHVTRATDEG